MRDLIDEVGRDAVRYFFLIAQGRLASSSFDVDLARSQTEENPVYYVQYAHARICSCCGRPALRAAMPWRRCATPTCRRSPAPYEQALLRRLADFPDELALAARELAPHQVTFYLRDLAAGIPQLL